MRIFRGTFARLLSVVVLTFCVQCSYSQSAVKIIKEKLAKSGIKCGFDEERKRYVAVESVEKDILDFSGNISLPLLRVQMARIAVFKAKADLLFAIDSKMSGEDFTRCQMSGDAYGRIDASIVDVFARNTIYGFTTLCSSESYANGRYQVAVAVAWSEKLEQGALEIIRGEVNFGKTGLNDEEWSKWLEGVSVGELLTATQFVGTDGIRRFAGVGYALLERHGDPLKVKIAKTKAKSYALQDLVFSLKGDGEAHNVAKSLSIEKGDVLHSSKMTVEEFMARVKPQGKLPFSPKVVYEGIIEYPLTGDLLAVCIYGAEPGDIRETMK